MTKKQYGAVIAKVRELCARPIGASQPEIKEAFNRTVFAPFVWLKILMDKNEVIRSGVYGEYRYFTDFKAAKAHDVKAKAERRAKHEAQRIKWNAEKSRKDREKRAKARAERANAPVVQAKVVQKKKAHKKEKDISITLYMRDKSAENVQKAKDQVKKHQAATIIWPESVKVQRIPTPEDVRFKAAPGYIGPFTLEYQERRAA